MFLIAIRNKDTGEEKSFYGPQEIANFLAGRDDASAWTGYEFLGGLPKAEVTAEAETPAELAPFISQEPEASSHDHANESLLEKLEAVNGETAA